MDTGIEQFPHYLEDAHRRLDSGDELLKSDDKMLEHLTEVFAKLEFMKNERKRMKKSWRIEGVKAIKEAKRRWESFMQSRRAAPPALLLSTRRRAAPPALLLSTALDGRA